ncbi:MAG: hypothetical protein DELT_01315 [Desulfovibrio sp.]
MEQRASGPVLFCNRDPRTLLLTATGAAVCFSLVQSIPLALACLALALSFTAICKPPLVPLLKRLAVANFFILFLWATVPFTLQGESLATFGPLGVSREGVTLALAVTVKCNAILLCFLTLLSGLSLPQIGHSLERLRVPVKLVFLFLFTCRYIHVIGEEWHTLQTAAKLRGFIPRTSLHTYATIGNMLGLTVVNSIDRSRRVYEAMLLRGFNGTYQTLAEATPARNDVSFTVATFFILFVLLFADVYVRYSYA